jgi:hypothetical protein
MDMAAEFDPALVQQLVKVTSHTLPFREYAANTCHMTPADGISYEDTLSITCR